MLEPTAAPYNVIFPAISPIGAAGPQTSGELLLAAHSNSTRSTGKTPAARERVITPSQRLARTHRDQTSRLEVPAPRPRHAAKARRAGRTAACPPRRPLPAHVLVTVTATAKSREDSRHPEESDGRRPAAETTHTPAARCGRAPGRRSVTSGIGGGAPAPGPVRRGEAVGAAPGAFGQQPSAHASGGGLQGELGIGEHQASFRIRRNRSRPTQSELRQANSGRANSDQANSGRANSGRANSGQANSGQANSDRAGSGRAGSGRAGIRRPGGCARLAGRGCRRSRSGRAVRARPGCRPAARRRGRPGR